MDAGLDRPRRAHGWQDTLLSGRFFTGTTLDVVRNFYVSELFAVQRLKTLSKEIATMDQTYYDFTTKMEKEGINTDYVQGWQSGYLLNPPREEQRKTDAYDAGYEDGKAHNMDNFSNWK
jgi:hypothetical protein